MFRLVRRVLIPASALLALIVLTPANAFAMHPSSGGSTQAPTTSTFNEHATAKTFAADLAAGPLLSLQEVQTIRLDTETRVSSAVMQGIINKINAAGRNGAF